MRSRGMQKGRIEGKMDLRPAQHRLRRIFVHVGLLVININRLAKHKALSDKWVEILPAKENVDKIISQLRDFQKKQNAIESLTKKSEVSWSEKINIISDSIPRGVWLKRISLTEDILFIEGSAISRQNNEMINVHAFTSNLKKSSRFLMQFDDLELGSIQRRKIHRIEIADFLISSKLK